MIDIDFLPASYRESRTREHDRLFRRVVLTAAIGLVGLGVCGHFLQQSRLAEQQDRLAAISTNENALPDPEPLRQQSVSLKQRAGLAALLQSGVPVTRVYAALTEQLPEGVTLSELRVAKSEPRAGRSPAAEEPTAEPPATGVTADLQRLWEQRRQEVLSATLHGLAPDDVAVSGYMAALQATGLFRSVELLFSERTAVRELPLREFEIAVEFRPPAWCRNCESDSQDTGQNSIHAGPQSVTLTGAAR